MPEIPQAVIDTVERALTKAITTTVSLADNTPYRDDPRWSPWTRFQKPVADRCYEARGALRAAAVETPEPSVPTIWICPDRRCSAISITDEETVRVTCTRREPHLPDREFPEKVKVDIAELLAVGQAAKRAVRESGNRSCRDGESPVPHVNPQAFAALAKAVYEATGLDESS